MSDLIEKARALRRKTEALAEENLDDTEAVEYKELFPNWDGNGKLYVTGDRVRYEDILYKVLQDHTSQPSWTPPSAPSLFAKVLNPDPEVIPVWEQPDSTNPYMKGDKVHFPGEKDPVYESVIDYNIWSPAVYAPGWKRVNES